MSGPLDNYRPILVSPRLSSFNNYIGRNKNNGQMTEYQKAQLDLQRERFEYNKKLKEKAEQETKKLKAKAEQDAIKAKQNALKELIAEVEIGNSFDVPMTGDHIQDIEKIEQRIDISGANAMQKEIDANPNKYIIKPIPKKDLELEKKLNDLALIKDKALRRKEELALIKQYGYDEAEEDTAITKFGKNLGSAGVDIAMKMSEAGKYLSPWRLFQTDSYKERIDNIVYNDYKKAKKFYEIDSPETFIERFRARMKKIRKDNDDRELAQNRLAKKFSKDVKTIKQKVTKGILLSPKEFNKKYQNKLNTQVEKIKNDTSLDTNQKIARLTYLLKKAQEKKANYERLRASILAEKQRQKKRQEKIVDAGSTEYAKEIAKREAERKSSKDNRTLDDYRKEKLKYENMVYRKKNNI